MQAAAGNFCAGSGQKAQADSCFENVHGAGLKGLFDIAIYTNTTADADSATKYSGSINLAAAADGAAEDGTLYVYVQVTWTSDTGDVTGDAADARDTWVGQNVTGVSYNLSYTAVQNSELPAGQN